MFIPVLCAVMVSCSKSKLELDPPTQVSPETALGTEGDLLIALRGAYAGMRGVDFFGRTLPVIGDVMGGNAYQSSRNTNRYTLFNNYTFNVTDGNVSGLWTTAYTVILRANRIINAPVASSVNVDMYKGEALTIRALCHFMLVRYFSTPYNANPAALGVPIVTEYDPFAKPTRNTVQEVYTQIINDLNQGYTLMTARTDMANFPYNSSQFNKHGAKALLAKVYMTMNDMANAKAAAEAVITSSPYTVVSAGNHAAYWAEPGIRADKVETIFEVSSDAVNNLQFDALSYLYSQAGNYGDFLVASDLRALFTANDVRGALYPAGVRNGQNVFFINKYPAISGDRSDTKVLRMAEMYLIAAEASAGTDETTARNYVNYVTSRRGADSILTTGATLYEDIITERRKELALEGDRFLDMQRLQRVIQRSTNFPAASRTIALDNFRRLLPIPQPELDANPNIRTQQNSGY